MKFALRSVPAAVAIGIAAYGSVASAAVLNISTLSNRPHLISGGDALVQITTDGTGAGVITLNGVEVTAMFHPGTTANTLLGVVTGLRLGANTLAAGGQSLVITNYSIKGPIISGPHVSPSFAPRRPSSFRAEQEHSERLPMLNVPPRRRSRTCTCR